MGVTRRKFIKYAGAATILGSIVPSPISAFNLNRAAAPLKVHLFSKHLQVSLHLEYPLGGSEKGLSQITVNKKVVFDAMKQDLTTVHKLWNEA